MFKDKEYLFAKDLNNLVYGFKGNFVVSGLSVSPGDGLTIQVSSGTVSIDYTEYTLTGGSLVVVPDSSYPRKAIVTASTSDVQIYHGVPALPIPSNAEGRETKRPVPPSIPTGEVLLAEIWVDANASSISAADISDMRLISQNASGGGGGYFVYRSRLEDYHYVEGATLQNAYYTNQVLSDGKTFPIYSTIPYVDIGTEGSFTIFDVGLDYPFGSLTFADPAIRLVEVGRLVGSTPSTFETTLIVYDCYDAPVCTIGATFYTGTFVFIDVPLSSLSSGSFEATKRFRVRGSIRLVYYGGIANNVKLLGPFVFYEGV